jgi:hypothetical protein
MENLSQQAEKRGIKQVHVVEALGVKKQAVNKWWRAPLETVPRKHIPALEGLGFRFEGRQYESTMIRPTTTRPPPALIREAQSLIDEVMGELKTPEEKSIYLGLVSDAADLLGRLRAAGRDGEIRLMLEKMLPPLKGDAKARL